MHFLCVCVHVWVCVLKGMTTLSTSGYNKFQWKGPALESLSTPIQNNNIRTHLNTLLNVCTFSKLTLGTFSIIPEFITKYSLNSRHIIS